MQCVLDIQGNRNSVLSTGSPRTRSSVLRMCFPTQRSSVPRTGSPRQRRYVLHTGLRDQKGTLSQYILRRGVLNIPKYPRTLPTCQAPRQRSLDSKTCPKGFLGTGFGHVPSDCMQTHSMTKRIQSLKFEDHNHALWKILRQ